MLCLYFIEIVWRILMYCHWKNNFSFTIYLAKIYRSFPLHRELLIHLKIRFSHLSLRMYPAWFSEGTCRGKLTLTHGPLKLTHHSPKSHHWFVAPGSKILPFIYREMIVLQGLIFHARGCIQSTVICVNSIFQMRCFFIFLTVFSAVMWWTMSKDKSCWNSCCKAVGCCRISQGVCVNNFLSDIHICLPLIMGSAVVVRQPAWYIEVCIIMKMILL